MLNEKDYIYCEDCEECVGFIDFWRHDYNIEKTGHKNCNWRYATTKELGECISACSRKGCFDDIAFRRAKKLTIKGEIVWDKEGNALFAIIPLASLKSVHDIVLKGHSERVKKSTEHEFYIENNSVMLGD